MLAGALCMDVEMAGSSFLRELHAGFATPPDNIVKLVHNLTGSAVRSLERIVNGYDNEVYRVRLDQGGPLFVRIRRGDGDFDGEMSAMDRARDAGVPVPSVLELARVESDDDRRDVMILAAARGESLEILVPSLSDPDRHNVLTDVGRVLARLHEIEMPGAWRPNSDGCWPDAAELRRSFISERVAERNLLFEAGLSSTEVDGTYLVLREVPDWAARETVLCHGDLNAGHVFVDGQGRVSCLIDWGMWHAGPPLGELAHVGKTFGGEGLRDVLGGYGRASMSDTRFRRGLAVTLAQQQIGYIAHHVTIGDRAGIEREVAALRWALAELG